jgi:hypothetical protein
VEDEGQAFSLFSSFYHPGIIFFLLSLAGTLVVGREGNKSREMGQTVTTIEHLTYFQGVQKK